jgi:hypothetical protein
MLGALSPDEEPILELHVQGNLMLAPCHERRI